MSLASSLILLTVVGFLYLYWFFKKAHRYFEENGIPHIKPKTFLGNMSDMLLLRKPMAIVHLEMYKKLAPYSFAGLYTFHKPSVMIRDPKLIKCVLTKDFAYFQNRGIEIRKDIEPLSEHLFSMKGEEWKNLRIKLTSTFTTGKMKMMFPLIIKCAEKLGQVLDDLASSQIEFEVKDICSRYSTDVIGSCAFGIDTGSLENPDSEFRQMGKRIFEFRYRTIIRGLFPNLPARMIKLLGLQVFPPEVTDYFLSIVKSIVDHRENSDITRSDFLDLLIALKNNTQIAKFKDQQEEEDLNKFLEQIGDKHLRSNVDMTVDLVASQCFLFFAAGFESSSSTLSFLFVELARHKAIQSKVRNEITSVLDKHAGILTYECLKEMTYMDMVVAETLRKYPAGSILLRKSTQNYKIPDTNVIIKEGIQVIIPVLGLHTDSQYYERPDEFYPEHFTEEAKNSRPHYTYLPFGEGPRVCIAERFAKLQVKICVVYMLQNHEFELTSRMKFPLEFAQNMAFLQVKGGVWLKCKKI